MTEVYKSIAERSNIYTSAITSSINFDHFLAQYARALGKSSKGHNTKNGWNRSRIKYDILENKKASKKKNRLNPFSFIEVWGFQEQIPVDWLELLNFTISLSRHTKPFIHVQD